MVSVSADTCAAILGPHTAISTVGAVSVQAPHDVESQAESGHRDVGGGCRARPRELGKVQSSLDTPGTCLDKLLAFTSLFVFVMSAVPGMCRCRSKGKSNVEAIVDVMKTVT